MITAIVTFVLLLTLGYIIFVHSGKQEGINKTIGYVVIGVIAVAVIAVPVYSLARGLGGSRDFAWRGNEGRPGMQGGIFTPGGMQQGHGGINGFKNFGNCPQGGMPQCPQGKDDWINRQDNRGQGRRNSQQFRGMPNDGCQMAPFGGQLPIPGQQNPGTQPRMTPPGTVNPQPGAQPTIPGTQQGNNTNPNANSGNKQPAIPNRIN